LIFLANKKSQRKREGETSKGFRWLKFEKMEVVLNYQTRFS
jgi:hypothetical protein